MSQKSAAFSAPRPLLDRAHFLGALVGILVVVHLWIMVDRGFDRGCFGFSEPTATVECELVIESDAGSLFGVSNAVWGLLFYGGIAVLGGLIGMAGFGVGWRRLRAAALTFGVAYSAWLVWVQATQLGAFCKLCLISAGIITFLFGLIVYEAVTRPSSDSKPMSKSRFYPAVVLAAVVLLVADLSYFSGLAVAQPAPEQAQTEAVEPATVDGTDSRDPVTPAAAAIPAAPEAAVCSYDAAVPPVANPAQLVTFSDPFLGSPNATVTVVEYFDPNCPHCRTYHPELMRAVESYGDKARFYIVPFMLWPQISMLPIEAMYVAAQDGRYHEMIEAQFREQGANGYTVEQLARMAKGMGLDEAVFTERLQAGLNRQSIIQRRQQIASIGIRGTPAVVINGKVVDANSKSAACLGELIDAELASK